MTRKQCRKCPWKVSTDPTEIPNGYCQMKHASLGETIAEPAVMRAGPLRMMACHETDIGEERPCVGWLAHQLGPGQNIMLRLAVLSKRVDADIELDGPQHERFEDTLP